MNNLNEQKSRQKELIKSEKESRAYVDEAFPLRMHKNIFPVNESISDDVQYTFLYTHWHNELEFFYLSRGECVFCIDGEEYPMKSGDAVFIPPGKTHWAYRLGGAQETVFYAIVFNKLMLTWCGTDTVNEKYMTPIVSNDLVIGPLITRREAWGEKLLDRLVSIMTLYNYEPYTFLLPYLFRGDVLCPELKVKSLLFDIWNICIENAKPGDPEKQISKLNYERIHRAIDFMHEHYSEKLTLTDIAMSVYMSKEYFSHVFKDATKMQPFVYLNSYHIQRSLELLDNSDYKIIEIAAMCGFDHVGYFNRRFMEYMKCTPTEYRKRKKGANN